MDNETKSLIQTYALIIEAQMYKNENNNSVKIDTNFLTDYQINTLRNLKHEKYLFNFVPGYIEMIKIKIKMEGHQ